MSVVLLTPHLLSGGVERGAVRYDDVVAAVGRGVPDRLVLAHEDDCDAGGETPQGGRGDSLWGGLYRREAGMGGRGRDVVPYSGVGESGLGSWSARTWEGGEVEYGERELTRPRVCDMMTVGRVLEWR